MIDIALIIDTQDEIIRMQSELIKEMASVISQHGIEMSYSKQIEELENLKKRLT